MARLISLTEHAAVLMPMTENLPPNHRLRKRTALGRRGGGKIQLSTTIALVVLFALAVITISIGIVQADTLREMVDDEPGRLALLGLVLGLAVPGALTAGVMWLTAPRPNRRVIYTGLDRAARSGGGAPAYSA